MSGNSAGDSSNIATNNVLGGQSIGTRGGGGACGRGWLTDYFIESYPAGSHTYYEIRHLVFIGRDNKLVTAKKIPIWESTKHL